jgi:transcription-repair coupling factor (superfamily II helicase)
MNSKESILLQNREFVRGGIVDVFSFRMIIHTELSFWDEVESIRSFDVATNCH